MDRAPDTGPEDGERARRLKLWGRLDWRFLLPDPRLGRVAFVGADDGLLLAALRLAAASVQVADDAPSGDASRFGADLVVVRGAPWTALERVRLLLAPGGFVYWENDRRPGAAPRGAFGRAAGFPWNPAARLAQRLARLGFHDIETHWHRPSFDSCLEMIPLHAPMVLRHALHRPASGARAQARYAAARALHRAGLLVPFVPCASVLARREPSAEVRP